MPREALNGPSVRSADCVRSGRRLFTRNPKPEASNAPASRTVRRTSTSTLGGSQASVKAIPAPTVYQAGCHPLVVPARRTIPD
jgi:hypothetical protein